MIVKCVVGGTSARLNLLDIATCMQQTMLYMISCRMILRRLHASLA